MREIERDKLIFIYLETGERERERESNLRDCRGAVAGLRDAPVSVAGQVLAEPRALLQNTLGLYEALLVTGGGDACQTHPSPLLSYYHHLVFPYRLYWHCSCPARLISSDISGDSSSNNSRPPGRHSGLEQVARISYLNISHTSHCHT